jgi:hypothetical protein
MKSYWRHNYSWRGSLMRSKAICYQSRKAQQIRLDSGYVATSSDTPSTSNMVFVKPIVLELPSIGVDKGKEVIGGDVPVSAKATQKSPLTRRPPICHRCGLSGNIRPQCSLLKAQRSKVKKELPRQATFGSRPLPRH